MTIDEFAEAVQASQSAMPPVSPVLRRCVNLGFGLNLTPFDARRLSAEIDVRVALLEELLVRARWYIETFEPDNHSDAFDQSALLCDLNEAMPPLPKSSVDLCGKGEFGCILPKNHEGGCNDIPF